jgi:formamidopyrimidine-DNA glycosylase
MPELPEVERGREIAELVCRGRRIEAIHCPRDPIALAGCSALAVKRALVGATVEAVARHGKQLWFELDRRPWLLVHFGMTGAFAGYEVASASERPRFCRLELALEGGRRLAFTDPRRFGRIGLAHDPRTEPPVSRLGFDPLLAMPSARAFKAMLAPRRGNVKALLLVDSLSPAEVSAIRSKLASVVRIAVEAKSVSSRFPKRWLFHRRWGKDASATTHDGRPLRHETIAGRTTAWVPGVQR